MGKKPKWVMVRLKKETHERLRRAIVALCAAMDRGTTPDARDVIDNSNPHALEMTFDTFITRLMNERDRHRVRSRKARTMKKLDERESALAEERGE